MGRLKYDLLYDAMLEGDAEKVGELLKGASKSPRMKEAFIFACEFSRLEVLKEFFRRFDWSKEIACEELYSNPLHFATASPSSYDGLRKSRFLLEKGCSPANVDIFNFSRCGEEELLGYVRLFVSHKMDKGRLWSILSACPLYRSPRVLREASDYFLS